MANTFGQIFKISSFGESHGKAIGGIIDGCPAGISIDYDIVQKQLDRRKPGQSKITSSRNENDEVEFLSWLHVFSSCSRSPNIFKSIHKSKDFFIVFKISCAH